MNAGRTEAAIPVVLAVPPSGAARLSLAGRGLPEKLMFLIFFI